MSGDGPRRGTPPRRGAAGKRAVRVAAAIVLFLLAIVLAIGVLRRDLGGPRVTPSLAVTTPPAPADRKAEPTARSRPPAAGASSPGRDGVAVRAAGSRERVPAVDRGPAGREGGGPDPGAPHPVRAVRGTPFPPVVVDGGQLRLFLAGIVSLPIVIAETETRIVVESAGDGGPAEVMIAAAPGGAAAVSVLSGTVVVAAGGRRVRVGPGTFTAVAHDAPPALPEALPLPMDHAGPSGGS